MAILLITVYSTSLNACVCVCVCRNWHWDEPSCGYEVCVVMYHQPSASLGQGDFYMFQWNDDNCETKNNFICKYTAGTAAMALTLSDNHCAPLTSPPFHPQKRWWTLRLLQNLIKQVKQLLCFKFFFMINAFN